MTCMSILVGYVKANPRDIYRYINSQRKDTQDIPHSKKEKYGSAIAPLDFAKAEEFNGQFTDVFTKMVHTQFKFHFWIGLLHSRMKLLLQRNE